MKKLFILLFTIVGLYSAAQAQAPANNECAAAVNLGNLPSCDTTSYSNVGATASNIDPDFNAPICFNGSTTQRDVWFAFTMPANGSILDITIRVEGTGGTAGLKNPQIALYRGDCGFGNLQEISCNSAPLNGLSALIDQLGLVAGETYYLRVNDYSASASPNAGKFRVCITKYNPEINIGSAPGSTACFGTLYDSGGPNAPYSSGQDLTFTICPNDIHACIAINVEQFDIETPFNLNQDYDYLNFYAGNSTTAPLIGRLRGVDNNNQFLVKSDASCITVKFHSDLSGTKPGFKLTWACSALPCSGNSLQSPVLITAFPFTQSASTCDQGVNFTGSPCMNDFFLDGPTYVYKYVSPGNICGSIKINGAADGTGVLVLNGLPSDTATTCVASSPSGNLPAVSFKTPGTYYIIVGNAQGCTPFSISLDASDCQLQPDLMSALGNPLNGCSTAENATNTFYFQPGFQDMDIDTLNRGCWLNVGLSQPNFYWFTIQAQADGPFGFVLQSAGTPSDIDFNVWGPFTQQQVLDSALMVKNFIRNHQPIRSSYAGGADPTGLVSINPVNQSIVTDEFDCNLSPDGNTDDFAVVINAKKNKVYVVLVNDWGNQIQNDGISVDWSPSSQSVLTPIPLTVLNGDTTLCFGDTARLNIGTGISNITWSPAAGLSCTNCLNPLAFPTQTTTYKVVVDGVCQKDSVTVKVGIYNVEAGPDVTVCKGEQFIIHAGTDYPTNNYTYQWTPATGLSCTNCPAPIFTASTAGVVKYKVTLTTPLCTYRDSLTITTLNATAPTYNIGRDTQLCIGQAVSIGGAAVAGVSYSWSSIPAGFSSNLPNPTVVPTATTRYYLSVTNSSCPVASTDSVRVEIFTKPVLQVAHDTMVCQGISVPLGTTATQPTVTYLWTATDSISKKNIANPIATPSATASYYLTAKNGVCTVKDTVNITVIPSNIKLNVPDTLLLCKGKSTKLFASTLQPINATIVWSPLSQIDSIVAGVVNTSPEADVVVKATINNQGCIKMDSVRIIVDSLPDHLKFAIAPADTFVCRGEKVILKSKPYEPADFPKITFNWTPISGQLTSDTLYNLVIQANALTTYTRITRNGACTDTSSAIVRVNEVTSITVTPQNPEVCPGTTVQLTAFAPDVTEYKWTPEMAVSCTPCPNPTVTPSSTTTYTVKGKYKSCPISGSTTVKVIPYGFYQFPANKIICKGEQIKLNTQPSNNFTYSWATGGTVFSTDPAPLVQPLTATTYVLTIKNGQCEKSDTVTITVVDATLSVNSDTTICSGNSIVLTASVVGTGGTYKWNTNQTTPTITVNPNVTQTYTVVFTYGNGCTKTAVVKVTVTPTPTFASKDTAICVGSPILLNFQPNAAYSHTWTSVPAGFSSTSPNPVVTPTATTIYFVKIKNGVCEKTGSVNVKVEKDTLDILGKLIVCEGEQIVLTPKSSAGGGTYLWIYNGISVNSPTLSISPSVGTTKIRLIHSSSIGCTTTDSATVTVNPSIKFLSLASDPSNDTVSFGAAIKLSIDSIAPASLTGLTYAWMENSDNLAGTGAVITVFPQQTTNVYKLTVTTAAGCSKSATITLLTVPIKIPNAFTPDGDNSNDKFNVLFLGGEVIKTFKIFDRWGKVVYNNEKPNEGWDGTFNGEPMPPDVYAYLIEYQAGTGATKVLSGQVSLIR